MQAATFFFLLWLSSCLPCRALTWRWSNPSPHGNNIVAMACNGYQTVQVAELGQIYTGLSFYGWLPRTSGTSNDLQAVTYFGNRIVACGANGWVGYSDDGVNFTNGSIGAPTSNWLVALAASPNLLVAVGDNAVIYTSANGATWQYQGTAPNSGTDWLLSVAWGAGTFVITGEAGYVATSPNGTNWTSHSITAQLNEDLERVTYVSTSNGPTAFPYTGFWAVTYSGHALYSTNAGSSWRAFATVNNTNILYAVTANNYSGLIGGDSDVQLGLSASNVIVWPKQTGPLPTQVPAWTYYDALWDTNTSAYRLVGDDGMMVMGTNANNNPVWQLQYNSVRDWLFQVTLAGDLYVAVGDNTRIMTSQNGVDWSVEAVPLTNSVQGPSATNTVFFCVGGTSNLLIAAGNHGSLTLSPQLQIPVIVTNLDGTTFTNLVGSLGVVWFSLPAPAGTTNDLAGVGLYNNNYYLVGGNGTILRSADGTNWSRISIAQTSYLSGLASSSNTIVATGDQGLILTSPDGLNWTQRTSGTTNWLWRLRYMNGAFLALGENGTMLRSTNNGVTWSSNYTSTANWLNDTVMVSNTCYVVGNNGTILASTNLVNWTNVPCITALSLYGAATQEGQLLVVGLQGSILRSQVIPDLTPLTIVTYSESGGTNLFLVAGDPDQQFTLDFSTNLVNWTTGPLLDLIYGSGTLVFFNTLPTNPPATTFYRATLVP